MVELPSGTVTFLFTDLEGSTRLWEQYPDAMRQALARHDEILRDAVAAHDGQIVKTTGDGVHAVFATARGALDAAVTAQRALVTAEWDAVEPLRVRMGVHTGEAECRDGDYYGTAPNRSARLMSVAHGGQVLVSLSTEELVSDALAEGLSLVDLGEQRLRDLSRPERIFQVAGVGLRREFPQIRSVDAFPGKLPLQVTSFIGRNDEIVDLGKILRDSRVVTVTGTGGVGKTRLAVQLAAELLQRFPDGAWLFELAAVTDAEAIAQVMATSLSVPPRPGVSLQDAVVELLRSKRALVVLDNCEHLLDAAANLAETLLRECEHLRIVATSREALGIAGERVWRLRSLELPEIVGSPAVVTTSDAGRLFWERAEAARPGFTIDSTNARAIAEICVRLDGIPLAIELAAARVVAMSPTEIAAFLDERFRLLSGSRRAAVERHRTLRATVEWSYGLLDARDRLVFDRLGVFSGTFDASAARAVVGDDALEGWDVLEALASLVAKSMLVVETGPDDTTRYQMLETLRQYALERLDEAGETEEFRRRHATYYASFAEEAGTALIGRDELAWRPRVNADRDNLRAAVYWAVDQDDDAATRLGLRIIAALTYEAIMDPPAGVGAWAERTLEVASRSTAPQRMAVFGAAAYEATNLAHHDLVKVRAETALRGGVDADSVCPGIAWFALSMTFNQTGDPSGGVRVGIEAVQQLEQLGIDVFGLVMLHCLVSYFAVEAADLITAREHAESALAIAHQIENPSVLMSALGNLGRSIERDDPVRALGAFEQAIALGRAGATELMMGVALIGVARLRSRSSDHRAALESLRDALVYSDHVGFRPIVTEVLGSGAEILIRAGRTAPGVTLSGSLLDGALAEIMVAAQRNAALERTLVGVRDELEPHNYEGAFTHGASMSYEQIVEFVLDDLHQALAEQAD